MKPKTLQGISFGIIAICGAMYLFQPPDALKTAPIRRNLLGLLTRLKSS